MELRNEYLAAFQVLKTYLEKEKPCIIAYGYF